MKNVLALGGGGPKGIYLEAGAVLALDLCLDDLLEKYSPHEEEAPHSLHPVLERFSVYQGNSAGALLAVPLAGGFSPDRLLGAIGSIDGDLAFSYSRYFKPALGEWFSKLWNRAGSIVEEIPQHVMQGRFGLWDFYHTLSKLSPDGLMSNAYIKEYIQKILGSMGLPETYAAFKEATGKELIILTTNLKRGTPRRYGWDEGTGNYPIPDAAQASCAIPLFNIPVLNEHGEPEGDGAVAKSLSVHGHIALGDFVLYLDPMIPSNDKIPSGILEMATQIIAIMNASRRETALHLQEAKQYNGKCIVLDIGRDHSMDYLRTDRIAESAYHGFMYVLGNAIRHHPDNSHHSEHDAEHAKTLAAAGLQYKKLVHLRQLYDFFHELHPRQFMHFVMHRGDDVEAPSFSFYRSLEMMFRNGHATANYRPILEKHTSAVQFYNALIPVDEKRPVQRPVA
ncbi:patatin-like phospholipase family protein [Candidatus Woesearchaeota archaeon]|nr:patatin-like phospholipase family protein [Candidatus Woesearchaeota archaeon]